MSVLVRFAPSPTGSLHIGNIRAALFNFLFARKHGGRFLLRMDDTDQERSKPAFEQGIKDDLAWLGLTWDIYAKQSERTARYQDVLEALKASGRVYPCFETADELNLKRKTQLGRGLPPVYDRAALNLSAQDVASMIAEGKRPHWRFKLERRDVVWDDLIQGHKAFPSSSLSDPVIVREDGVPLYTFCSVIDDVDMGVTHIIRGEDHVTNTSVQIQLWEAVTDKPTPQWAHYPLMVNITGEAMSKRLGTMSIASLRDDLRLEAMAINSLLARLGTSDSAVPCLDLDDLAATFDLAKISRSTVKFDLEELKHMSAKILHQTSFPSVGTRLDALGLGHVTEAFWNAVRANLLTIEDVRLWWHVANGPVAPILEDKTFVDTAAALLPPAPWDDATWGIWTHAIKDQTGRKGKDLFMPLRLALTGMDHGPEMKALLPLIGQEKAIKRLAGEEA